MKVLVIGGTRFFGKLIVENLLSEGFDISIFTRGNIKPRFSRPVKHIRGDMRDYPSFISKVGKYDFDVVIDNIAYNGRDVESVIQAFKGKISRYVLTSSTTIYRVMRYTNPVREEDARIGSPLEVERETEGASSMQSGEEGSRKVLFRIADEGEFPFTIIRPPVVQGEGDPSLREYFWIQRAMDGGPVLIPDRGLYMFRHVYASDLARAYVLALDNEKAVNKAYNVAQREILTLKEYVQSICEVLGVEFRPVYVPSELAERCLGYKPPYFRRQVLIPNISSAEAELGFRSTFFVKWLEKMVRWYIEEYGGPDSPGYDKRALEIKFSEIWKKKKLELRTLCS
ncbi:MAG: hypothetical protein DRO00_09830 [Thermoproteota archaeon]|nr:MAG: hypothetical protein DRO00_09830 [Candidatus Korarchaeota archaeon]